MPGSEVPKDPEKAKVFERVNYLLLQDLSEEQFARGLLKFLKTHKEVFPNTNLVAYIREYGLLGEFLTAGEAWGVVLDEIRRVSGNYGTPAVKNELVQKAIECTGWRSICDEEAKFVRAQFFKTYDSLVEKKKREVLNV